MSSYIYNSNDFDQPQTYITQQQADRLYLNSQGNDTISGTLTADELSIRHVHTDTLLVDNAITAGVTGTTNRLHGSLYAGSTSTNTHRLTGSLTIDNTLVVGPSSGISLTFLPRLQSDIQPSHAQDLCSKSYVDAQDSLLSSDLTSYRISLRSTLSMDGPQNVLTSPALGTSITTNSTGVALASIYCNLPPVAGTESINTFTFQFNYSYTVGKIISDALTKSTNSVERGTPFTSDLQAAAITGHIVSSSCVFTVSLLPGGLSGATSTKLIATGPLQTRSIWNNTSNVPVVWQNTYGTAIMSWTPLFLGYSTQNKVLIQILGPNQANRANQVGWISNLSASIQLISSSSDTGQIGKTNAYLSLS